MTRYVSVVLAVTAVAAAGCSGSSSTSTTTSHPPAVVGGIPTKPPIPAEFIPACGHPGASVRVEHVPVTIRHADCDLTGVTVSYKRHGGAVVGDKPGGVANSGGFSMSIHKHTLDVTIHSAKGPVGNV